MRHGTILKYKWHTTDNKCTILWQCKNEPKLAQCWDIDRTQFRCAGIENEWNKYENTVETLCFLNVQDKQQMTSDIAKKSIISNRQPSLSFKY